MGFNKIILQGNTTKDGELKYTQGGIAIYTTSIAVSRRFKSNNETKEEILFVDCTFFARSAEIANQYLRKGSKILVEGRLSFDQWVDQNGQKRSKHSVVVETMQMLDTKGSSEPQSRYDEPIQQLHQPRDYDNNPDTNYTAYKQPEQQRQMPQSPDGFDFSDEEIPFSRG